MSDHQQMIAARAEPVTIAVMEDVKEVGSSIYLSRLHCYLPCRYYGEDDKKKLAIHSKKKSSKAIK